MYKVRNYFFKLSLLIYLKKVIPLFMYKVLFLEMILIQGHKN